MLYQKGYTPQKRTKQPDGKRKTETRSTAKSSAENAPEAEIERNLRQVSSLQDLTRKKLNSLIDDAVHLQYRTLGIIHARIDYHKYQWERYSRLRDKILKRR